MRRACLTTLTGLTTFLSACAFEPNVEGALVSHRQDGLTYDASYVLGAFVDTSGGTAEISPFPRFHDGILVTRRDGVTMTEADRPAAVIAAAKYCARAGQVPRDPDGWFLPNNAGWYFSECEAEQEILTEGQE